MTLWFDEGIMDKELDFFITQLNQLQYFVELNCVLRIESRELFDIEKFLSWSDCLSLLAPYIFTQEIPYTESY